MTLKHERIAFVDGPKFITEKGLSKKNKYHFEEFTETVIIVLK